MEKKLNSIGNILELHLFCIEPLIWYNTTTKYAYYLGFAVVVVIM